MAECAARMAVVNRLRRSRGVTTVVAPCKGSPDTGQIEERWLGMEVIVIEDGIEVKAYFSHFAQVAGGEGLRPHDSLYHGGPLHLGPEIGHGAHHPFGDWITMVAPGDAGQPVGVNAQGRSEDVSLGGGDMESDHGVHGDETLRD